MKNKWNSKQVRAAQAWLVATWPHLFTSGRDLKPLSLKIHKDILQQPGRPAEVSRRALMEALKRHTTSFGYLYGIIKFTHRHNLTGEQEEVIFPAHKQWAKQTLRKIQKLSQATSRRNARNKNFAPKTRAPRVRSIPKKAAETRITYKKQRRRIAAKPTTPTPSVAA